MKTIIAISGSLRQGSSNHAILEFLSSQLPADVNYTFYNGLIDIPAFDPGLDTDTPPAAVALLRQSLIKADGFIICTPEYAFGVPGSLKNMLDWLVSSSTLVDKPVALITASLGGEHAHASLLLTLGALSANVIDDATLLIQFIRAKFGPDGHIKDEETLKNLQGVLSCFLKAI
ncbi:NADPH-dependent FMN reductase [Mucilaginibacter antarcticus]|uniref:NADPH-dependent FMN reductase n=1 Tax=Mucilaginibacter antarcticus TaxID=1855725 RepID=A0ABW5XRJ1_9SPHI